MKVLNSYERFYGRGGKEMTDQFLITLEIMAKGMGRIFAACLVIMAAVWVMGKISGKK